MLSQAVSVRTAGTNEEYRGRPDRTDPAGPSQKRSRSERSHARDGLERAIALRWILRDIRARRLKLSPVSASDLATLTELGLIEMHNDAPVLTQAGDRVLD